MSSTGHFASVAVASADQASAADDMAVPLWRGRGMHVRFEGLAPVSAPRPL